MAATESYRGLPAPCTSTTSHSRAFDSHGEHSRINRSIGFIRNLPLIHFVLLSGLDVSVWERLALTDVKAWDPSAKPNDGRSQDTLGQRYGKSEIC